MNQCTYISEWLKKDYKMVYNQLHAVMAAQNIPQKELPYSEEVWARDYMPVHIGGGRYVGFEFKPDYLWDYPSRQKYITKQELAVGSLSIDFADKVELILDGGNYVRCGDKVVMTDKDFSENPNWRPVALIDRLEKAFQAEMVFLPWDMDEPFGHSDGMMTWLGENKILLNNYNQLECTKEKPFLHRLIKILDFHFDIVELKYDCKPSSKSWCYLNYIETEKCIIIPALSEHHDSENDQAALSFFQQVFKNKTVKQVYALPLIKHGGALHCITWEYFSSC